MSRLLPHPLLTLALAVMWLLLQQSLSLGHALLGLVVGALAGLAMALLDLPRPRIRHPLAIIRLAGRVTMDIAHSNLEVSRIILSGRRRPEAAGFVRLPLELTDPTGLAVFACIVTALPGSAWIEYNSANGSVLIHVLSLEDETVWIETLKSRYETLLVEIFQ